MDNLLMAHLVIVTVLALLSALIAILYWCCDYERESNNDIEHLDLGDSKARCIRLQMNSVTGLDPDITGPTKVFLLDEDPPPLYEYPPAYKSISYYDFTNYSSLGP